MRRTTLTHSGLGDRRILAMVKIGCVALPEQERAQFETSQETTERLVAKSGGVRKHGLQIAPEDAPAANDIGLLEHPVYRHCRDEIWRGPHKVLAESPAQSAHPDALLAATHLPQMDEPEFRTILGSRNPSLHSAHVAVDAVPAYLSDEPTDFLERGGSIELRLSNGVLVAQSFGDESSVRLPQIRLPGEIAEVRIDSPFARMMLLK
jgi:hypothetical protein